MRDLELPEERTVMRNIEDMLYEENKLYASLFQAATRLLDQNPGMRTTMI